MRRHIKYIILSLITFFAAVSCIEEMESPHVSGREQLTLVPRVTSFTNQYVTKAAYDSGEDDINRLAVLVFNNQGTLVHFQESTSTATVTLNRSMFNHSGMTNSTIVMIANMDLSNITKGTAILSTTAANKTVTLSDMEDYVFDFGSNVFYTSVPDSGFPMIGGVSGVDFTKGNDEIAVNLKVLFAKVSLEIAVENGTENTLNTTQFTISNATITNLAKATPLAIPAEAGETPKDFLGNVKEDEDPSTSAGFTKTEFVDISSENKVRTITSTEKTVSAGSTSGKYTFYIAENRYNHGGTTGIYPDTDWEDTDLYDNYKQQYKPKLATGGQGKPTYITLTGTYTDYRSTQWSVNYTVYLGKNNYDNFHIDRNSEYTNKITIKGLRNNNSYKEYDDEGNLVDQHVWIDHRVDVELGNNQGADDCVTITRETLIDAHIEVRPLRISLAGSGYQRAAIYLPKYPADNNGNVNHYITTTPSSWIQLDEIMGGANENWIAIENNNGSTNKGRTYLPSGKRKYFTTSLIEELHAESSNILIDSEGNKYIPLADGDCVWIYFDENGTEKTRQAKIDVVFYNEEATITESYNVYQQGYIPVGEFKLENYEEYLHTYDSEDKYSLTTSPIDFTQEGLEWGHTGKVFSQNNIATEINISGLLSNTTANLPYVSDIRYDYLHNSDMEATSIRYLYSATSNWSPLETDDIQKETGLYFTERATAIEPSPITIIDMETSPTSAYQYCLSKNKFREDADDNHTLDIHWYLPDVYELNAVLNDNLSYADLSSKAYYWSSQPSYTDRLESNIINAFESLFGEGTIIDEDPSQARAVSKDDVRDFERTRQNRIRCFYSPTGITEVNMSERVPSGLGGVIKVHMKAYVSYRSAANNVPGFFSAWLTNIEETDASTTPSKTNHKFPKGESTNYLETFTVNNVLYYAKNPATSGAWKYVSQGTIYNTLDEYPGLSPKEIVRSSIDLVEGTNDKHYTRTEGKMNGQEITSMPDNNNLAQKPLDYLENTNILTISFSNGTNSTKAPTYSYRREDKSTTTYSQRWIVPTYTSKTVTGSTGSKREVTVDGITYSSYEVGDDYVYNGVMHTITAKRWSIFAGKFTLGPKTYNQGWTYNAGTGGWGNEKGELGKEDSSQPKTTIDTKYDKLELFGGNSFTITAKQGYRIKSIKVNFTDDNKVPNITGDRVDISYRSLRLVDGSQELPSSTAPKYMAYSGDGEAGWYQWLAPTVDDYASSVTLKLVAYAPIEASLRPTSFQYVSPSSNGILTGYRSDFDTSIVIDNFEIRVEEVEESTNTE